MLLLRHQRGFQCFDASFDLCPHLGGVDSAVIFEVEQDVGVGVPIGQLGEEIVDRVAELGDLRRDLPRCGLVLALRPCL